MVGAGLSGSALSVCFVSPLLAAQQKPVVDLHVAGVAGACHDALELLTRSEELLEVLPMT